MNDSDQQHYACKSILIVEDEDSIRENLQSLLEFEGYSNIFTATNGKEGLEILRSIPSPCLILLDLLMPTMNGSQFLEEKLHNKVIALIPVCIVSGVSEAPNLPVQGYIKKPIDFDGLMKFVRKYCGEPYQQNQLNESA